jgi:hypothetical protein
MIKSESPMHCSTSITIKYVPIFCVNSLVKGNRNKYPIAISIKPLLMPFLILMLVVLVSLDFIKRKVKISPDIVKKVGAVIPLKYCHKLKAKFV